MARDTAAIGEDVVIGTDTPDQETTVEALIRAYNRLPLDTNLAVGDRMEWDGTAWIPAGSGSSVDVLRQAGEELKAASGATNTVFGGTMLWAVVQLADAANNDALATFDPIPADWATFDVVVTWAAAGAGTDNVYFLPVYEHDVAGGTTDSGRTVGTAVTPAAAGANVLVDTTLVAGLANPGTGLFGVRLQRQGGHADDTQATAVHIYGIELRKAS